MKCPKCGKPMKGPYSVDDWRIDEYWVCITEGCKIENVYVSYYRGKTQ